MLKGGDARSERAEGGPFVDRLQGDYVAAKIKVQDPVVSRCIL